MTYPAGLNVTKVSTDIFKHQKLTQGGIKHEGGDMKIFLSMVTLFAGRWPMGGPAP